MNRRAFLTILGSATVGLAFARSPRGAPTAPAPSHLRACGELHARDPRAAAIAWFREARFGLFIYYGLYSLEGCDEWLQLREKIPVAEYAKLKERFTAAKFDVDAITDLALAAQMRYMNIATRHHDSFCLFRAKQTDSHSLNSPAKRDLVGELAAARAPIYCSTPAPRPLSGRPDVRFGEIDPTHACVECPLFHWEASGADRVLPRLVRSISRSPNLGVFRRRRAMQQSGPRVGEHKR